MVFCWPVRTYESSKRVEERLRVPIGGFTCGGFFLSWGYSSCFFLDVRIFLLGSTTPVTPRALLVVFWNFEFGTHCRFLVYEIRVVYRRLAMSGAGRATASRVQYGSP